MMAEEASVLFKRFESAGLVGVWIGGVWNGHFQESGKYLSEAEVCRKMPGVPQKERFFAKFQAPKFENSEPEKCNSIPRSHSIPPLDSLHGTLLLKAPTGC